MMTDGNKPINVTFKVIHEEKSWGDNIYDLDVLIDGKRTGILIQAGSGSGSVEGTITLFYGDILGVYMEGNIKLPSTDPSRMLSIPYEIKIKGTIRHLKKYVIENIKEILDIVHPHVQALKDEISGSADVIHQVLEEDEK
ncbi:MAG: hypothetical protein KAW52_03390 [candidate division Zixibacteria bacterium]|nr:hypothetical protein [candidate division Zixibacteria bacterium]